MEGFKGPSSALPGSKRPLSEAQVGLQDPPEADVPGWLCGHYLVHPRSPPKSLISEQMQPVSLLCLRVIPVLI